METDFMDKWKKERDEKRDEERKRLLAISDYDAEKLPIPDRYQRMRYQREIEAAKWLEETRRKMPENSEPVKKRYKKQKNVIVFDRD